MATNVQSALPLEALFRIVDGHARASLHPGLGATVDDKRLIEASARGTDWRNPARRHADGSVAAEFEGVTRMRHARR